MSFTIFQNHVYRLMRKSNAVLGVWVGEQQIDFRYSFLHSKASTMLCHLGVFVTYRSTAMTQNRSVDIERARKVSLVVLISSTVVIAP